MFYPEDIVEEVRSKNNIVDVISGYVRIQKRGSTYFGLCPFHNEKTPSFSVTPSKGMYYCFGCGAGGNVFTFIMNHENATFGEAIKMLADRAGVKLPEVEITEDMRREASEKAILLDINKEAAKYYYYYLRSPSGSLGKKYFDSRELSEDTQKHFGLGYAGSYSDGLLKYLRGKDFADEMIIKAGLAVRDKNGNLRDMFWNRVMFPIQDMNHRVIGFGGRVMGDAKPKYLNSPENPIFDKSRNLYGMNWARSGKKSHLILCEGYMDVIAMHQTGFTEAVATLGTALTSGHANILKKFVDDIILSYDSDGAGINATKRAIGILKELDINTKVLNLKPYKDPDEFIKNLGREELEKRINEARNSFYFEVDVLSRDYDLSDPGGKTRFYKTIAQMLCEFTSDVERENYLEAICREYTIDRDGMRKLVIEQASKKGLAALSVRPVATGKGKVAPEEGIKKAQRMLLTWISEEPKVLKRIEEYITPDDFTEDMYRTIAKELWEGIDNGGFVPAQIISRGNSEEEQKEIAAMFNAKITGLDGIPIEMDNEQDKMKVLKDILIKVKENSMEIHKAANGTDLNKIIADKKLLEKLRREKNLLG